MNKILKQIINKPELKGINLKYVKDLLNDYLIKNKIKIADLSNPKSSLYKKTIKEVRAELRRIFGLFRTEKLPSADFSKEGILRLLSNHASTKERLPYYRKLYQEIFKITGRPKSISDLACGLNPLSIEFMGLDKLKYYAYDLSEQEKKILNDYFKILNQKNSKFTGKAEISDLRYIEKIKKLPKADVAFLFKVVDLLDSKNNHRNSEAIMVATPAKFLVVSFPTKTMSGKQMTAPERKWMQWLCERRKWKYQTLTYPGEIFYVIKK